MLGAESLLKTLINSGVEVCFANPGTSEMHFVAALDRVDGMRCVLGLQELVVTGAADGYSRMAGKPAATLLHLGPGLANGLANLHNARRGHGRIVNIIGEHAIYHVELDSPLTSDIESLAKPMSHWVKTAKFVEELPVLAAEAVAVAILETVRLPASSSLQTCPGVKMARNQRHRTPTITRRQTGRDSKSQSKRSHPVNRRLCFSAARS